MDRHFRGRHSKWNSLYGHWYVDILDWEALEDLVRCRKFDASGEPLRRHPYHLNTPRLVANQAQQAVWKWDQTEPFGVNVPDENPSSVGTFDLPLRLPGQLNDKETNLYYNYFRDYDPGLGIHKQSDPIGIRGGLNTYSYVDSVGEPLSPNLNVYLYARANPLRYVDPTGLDATIVYWSDVPTHIGIGINSPSTVGLYPQTRPLARLFTCRDVPGAIVSDSVLQAGSMGSARSLIIKTTPEQDLLMQQFINLVQQGGAPTPNWNACSNHCASFVSSVLRAGGVGVPTSDNAPLPKTLFDALRSQQGNLPGR